jgi:hypothetical protein
MSNLKRREGKEGLEGRKKIRGGGGKKRQRKTLTSQSPTPPTTTKTNLGSAPKKRCLQKVETIELAKREQNEQETYLKMQRQCLRGNLTTGIMNVKH